MVMIYNSRNSLVRLNGENIIHAAKISTTVEIH